jgi:hypothetical protein
MNKVIKVITYPVNYYIGTLSAAGRARFARIMISLMIASPIIGLIILAVLAYFFM